MFAPFFKKLYSLDLKRKIYFLFFN